jgi:enamine deaminase RidA (YjgF/YER057c/UK114 family)
MQTRMKILLTIAFTAGVAAGLFAAPPAKKLAKQFLNANGEKPPGYTHVVTAAPGKMIFVSGAGGVGVDGKMPADFETQAKNTFENLKRNLGLASADFKDVVKINYFVKDMANTAQLRQVRSHYVDMEHPPASTLVETGLGPGLLLEVELVAMIPE